MKHKRLLLKKERKTQSRREEIVSFIYCSKCNSDIAVKVNRNPSHVLRGHQRSCSKPSCSQSHPINSDEKSNDDVAEYYDDDFNNENIEIDMNDGNNGNDDDDNNGVPINDRNQVKDPVKPNRFYFKYQKELSKAYKRQQVKINNRGGLKGNVQNNIDIASFMIDKNLSNTDFNDLMTLINNIVARERSSNGESKTLFPTNLKTLKRQCMTDIISSDDDKLFKLVEWKYRLDEDIFPDHQKTLSAFSYDILQIISDELLNMDPLNFITKPDIKYVFMNSSTTQANDKNIDESFIKKVKERLFSDYTSGYHFELMHNAVTINGLYRKRVALCIGITLDETTTYSSRRSFTPVYMFILNVINGDFKMHLIGYAPGGKLPYQNVELRRAIINKFPTRLGKNKLINDVIKHQCRQFQRKFLYDILEPILATQTNGIELQIGPFENQNSFKIHAFIHLCMITGDHAQLEF